MTSPKSCLERGPPALARAEARNKAKHAAEQSLAAEESSRQAIRTQRTRLAAILVPLIVTIAATWIALLTILNVRQRRDEIGILRTIGLGSRTILLVLLGKSVVAGLAGGLLGLAIGFTLGLTTGDLAGSAHAATKLWSPGLVLMTALAAPGLSLLAGWLPALLAARTDPATVLAGS